MQRLTGIILLTATATLPTCDLAYADIINWDGLSTAVNGAAVGYALAGRPPPTIIVQGAPANPYVIGPYDNQGTPSRTLPLQQGTPVGSRTLPLQQGTPVGSRTLPQTPLKQRVVGWLSRVPLPRKVRRAVDKFTR